MIYLSAAVILQEHFVENRTFAAGMGLCGLSIGNIFGSPIAERLVTLFGWRGALLIHSALMMHCIPLSMLLRTSALSQTLKRQPKKAPNANQNEKLRNFKDLLDSDNIILGSTRTLASFSLVDSNDRELETGKHPNDVTQKGKSTFRLFLAHLCDFSLLRKTPFLLFCLGNFGFYATVTVFWTHVQSRAVYLGIPEDKSSFLTSIAAFALLIGRILVSFFANFNCINVVYIFSMGCLFGTIASVCIALSSTYTQMCLSSLLNGLPLGKKLHQINLQVCSGKFYMFINMIF